MAYVASVNNQCSVLHRVTDLEGALSTGSVTGFAAALYNPSLTLKPTLVTWSEPSASGYISFLVTPDAAGNWLLQVTNPSTSSDAATYDYYIQTVASVQGLTPSGTWLTTLSNLKERLGITGTSDDAQLTNIIARASTMIEARLGRPILSATYTEDYDGTGGHVLTLRKGPIQSVTSVSSLEWSSATTATATAVADDTYRVAGKADEGWRLPGYIVADGWHWTRSIPREWRVVYVAGFTTVPYDIENLCLDVCVWLRNQRKDTGNASRDVGAGGESFRPINELYELIDAGLSPYNPVI